jgi:lipid-A-disaccharide synthase-like uncharacterized protein
MLFHHLDFDLWTLLGGCGQGLFLLSFVMQWRRSERLKTSVVTRGFWIVRILASIILLVYSYHRRDFVFLCSALFQIFIYWRNLQLLNPRPANPPTC